jgi:ABC-type dipeptide/oligopeptide/nickel transport system permease subunit
MAADGFQAIRLAPHIVLEPALALSLTVMAFYFLGDGLRDFLDPSQRRRASVTGSRSPVTVDPGRTG